MIFHIRELSNAAVAVVGVPKVGHPDQISTWYLVLAISFSMYLQKSLVWQITQKLYNCLLFSSCWFVGAGQFCCETMTYGGNKKTLSFQFVHVNQTICYFYNKCRNKRGNLAGWIFPIYVIT